MLVLAAFLLAQVTPAIHAGFRAEPPLRTLPLETVAAAGVWNGYEILQVKEGLWFRRNGPGAPPRAIRLPVRAMPLMPEPSHMSHFGELGLEKGQTVQAFCADKKNPTECEAWFLKSASRRVRLEAFMRRRFAWQAADGGYRETASAQAWGQLPGDQDAKLLAQLRPTAAPRILATDSSGFDLLIPWRAFPVQSDLTIRTVKIEFETDNQLTAILVELERPRVFQYSSCALPLAVEEDWTYSQIRRPGFFLPGPEDAFDTIYAWGIPMGERFWGPLALSPELKTQTAKSIALASDEHLCGPVLSYRRGDSSVITKQVVRGVLEYRRLPNGGLLVLDPPRVHSYKMDGNGMCGGVPGVQYEIYHVSPRQAIRTVKSRLQRMFCDGPATDLDEMEVEFSTSFDRVFEYRVPTLPFELQAGAPPRSKRWQVCTSVWNGTDYVERPCVPSPAPAKGRLGKELDNGWGRQQ